MANFKIFQDSSDQARVKIYGSNNTALNTDCNRDYRRVRDSGEYHQYCRKRRYNV